MDPVTGMALAAAGNMMGNIFDVGSTIYTNAQNAKENQKNRDWNLKMWQMQNEYNTPSAQMARYKAAGLNPALIYGSGASGGNAGSIPASSPVQYRAPSVDMPNLISGLVQLQQIKNLQQKNLTEIQKTTMAELQNESLGYNNRMMYGVQSGTNIDPRGPIVASDPLWLKQMKSRWQLADSQQKLNSKLLELRSQEASMNAGLKKYNMTSSDPTWLRGIMYLGQKLGIF